MTSGAIYAAVPTAVLALENINALETPKSANFTCPFELTKKLLGLRSAKKNDYKQLIKNANLCAKSSSSICMLKHRPTHC